MRFTVCWIALLLPLLVSLPSYGAITSDLVGLYEFENNFLDSSGSSNLNHGTPVNNPGFTAGKLGTAMSLAGLGDYLSFDPATLTDFDFGNTDSGTDTDFTMSMWIRQDDFLSDPAVLSNKDWDDGENTGINWAVKGNGVFDLNTKASSGSRRDLDTLSTSSPLTVGAWNLVVMSVDRDGGTQLYINGNNTGSIPVTSSGTFSSGLPWNIGQDGTGEYGVEFAGAVDELAIWHRALSADEADSLWNNGNGIALGEQVVDSQLRMIIDRQTGSLTIENNTGVSQSLIGYQITSEAGAFDQSRWTPIAGRLDAAGDGSLDADDNWLVGTAPGSVSDLVELSLGAGSLPAGESINLGPGLWAKYYLENSDVAFQYADGVGDELISGLVEFSGGSNEPFAFPFGDINFDGLLDSEDWTTLQSEFGSSVASLSEAQRYRSADLNNDGIHSLEDLLAFQQAYDAINGVGSFQTLLTAVPEPNTTTILILLTSVVVAFRSRQARTASCWLLMFFALDGTQGARAASLFAENFDGVPLGANVDEGLTGTDVWTATPPANWTIDNSGLPGGGVTEWRGWSFADPTWWSATAEDQLRSEFTKSSGSIAVADPDEWADLAFNPGFYNTFLTTPNIALAGVAANTVQLRFDSSWRPEDTQTASVRVSFDGQPSTEVLKFSSVAGDTHFKPDATNETITLPVNNPAGATNIAIEFGMTDAGNDWWWAIDNIEVFSPLALQVDVQSGALKILGDPSVELKGYEIYSPGGSNAPTGWAAGNLDAQEIGNSLPATADFNADNAVDALDLAIWSSAYAATTAADSDLDNDTDGADFLRWQRLNGSTSDAGSTWLTFQATDQRLTEAYLLGSSVFANDVSLGLGYDTTKDLRDLQFSYTTADNEIQIGSVQYINTANAIALVPEPTAYVVACGIFGIGLISCRSRHW